VVLQYQPFQILRLLLESGGEVVSREEIRQALWSDETFVDFEHSIATAMKKLRQALGDDADHPQYIETLTRRGYRWLVPVEWVGRRATSREASSTSILSAIPDRRAGEPDRPAHARLAGRDQALGELRDYLRVSLRAERQIAFITGESGIGKTALADQFQRQATADVPGIRIARGQSVEGYGGKEAYYPMLEALGQLCRGPGGEHVVQALATHAPTWLVQFPALVKREHRKMLQREILGATRARMLREVGDVLDTLAAESPLLLVFEDIHWVDYSTVDLILALARRREPARLMVLATYRPHELPSEHPLTVLRQDLLVHQLCHEVALGPLDEAQVAEYLAAGSRGVRLPEGFAELVHRRSEGNPLFMVAALNHLMERRLISWENGSWILQSALKRVDLEVPESLRLMIEAQIARLAKDEQQALEVASVSGTTFSPSLVGPAAGLDPDHFESLCQGLSRRHHVVRSAESQLLPDGTVSHRYEFVHGLYQEVFYRRQAPGRRAKLHRSVAERLEVLFSDQLDNLAPELALHYEQGTDWVRAVRYLGMMAETAGRRYAPREAAAILQHALDLSSKLPEPKRGGSETEILEKLAAIYLVSFDGRVVDTYEALAARAAQYGLIDVEVRALVDMAYPMSWTSSGRCLDVLERALRLSVQQRDPLTRARTRASCLVRRVWVGGWNSMDVEECLSALDEIRRARDPLLLASHLIDCNFIQWSSSRYREAHRDAVESLAILTEGAPRTPAGSDVNQENPYLSTAYWMSQFILPWSLLLGGEWGEALREIRTGIAMVEKNGDFARGQTLRVYEAWLYLHAMDFSGVVAICESLLPTTTEPAWSPWRRLCLVFAGSAATALGKHALALDHLTTARDEMDRQTVIHDWYTRMMLEAGLTELWLAKSDLTQARPQAERFLEATLATAERTWQALAWEANARVAMAESQLQRAQDCIAKGFATMEGFEVPLAGWRLHATAAEFYEHTGKRELAGGQRELSRSTIWKLANSLPTEEPLRKTFLSAPAVCGVLGTGERKRESTAL
jgi:DNA-binding winged helix-turn-helix (wHTH) protein